jgi:sulfonate dioxygenase
MNLVQLASMSVEIETVHPVTGWKSVHVNPGVIRRMLGVRNSESELILNVLFHQVVEGVDFQVRFHREPNSIAFWDDRVSTVSTRQRA